MKKRFILSLDSSTTEQDELFEKFVDENGLDWWHWLNNLWLLVDPKGNFSASEIRDEANRIYPHVNKLVLEIRSDDDTWSGFGPSKPEKDMFKWIKENW